MSFQPGKLASPTRASPFRRPESPSSPSPSTARYQSTRPATPSRLQNSSVSNADGTWSAPAQAARSAATLHAAPASPTRRGNGRGSAPQAAAGGGRQLYNTDALGKLPPAQVREMREAFQILDRNSDGLLEREDVADMLNQLGMDSSSASTSGFFPPQGQHPLPMSAYLSSLSTSLAQMSPPTELLAALSAFDDDDSGQIDINDLTDALMHTAPDPGDASSPLSPADMIRVMQDFSGKRAFSKHSTTSSLNKGDVFRYREWVSSLQAVEGEKVQAA